MWEEIRSWTCFIGAIIGIGSLIIKYYKKNVPNLVVQPRKYWGLINVYTPLLMAVLILIFGMLLFILAPMAFERQHLLHNSYSKAYGAFFSLTLFTIVSFPLSKIFYEEYKDAKTKQAFS